MELTKIKAPALGLLDYSHRSRCA